VEYWKKDDDPYRRITCQQCRSSFHLGCFDPPQTMESYQRMIHDGSPIICARCTPCRGCYQKDIVFGSHWHPSPATLSFPRGESLDLCSMCQDAYAAERFCPNCAHAWDDVKFTKVRKQVDWLGKSNKKRKAKDVENLQDTEVPLMMGYFTGDDTLPLGAKVDPLWFHPETSEWGYTEVEMLVCDSCKVWVHAGCAGIDEDEYDRVSDGDHEMYSKEFLCRVCCRQRCRDLIAALQREDVMGLFAVPVTDKMAPNYRDIIKHPMDLSTMMERANNDEYNNYAWVREMFELMVLNALTFNRHVSLMDCTSGAVVA
jgi:Bromodomain